MIICSCNVISHREIEAVVEELVASDANVVVTPGMVYRAMGHRPKCGTCFQNVVDRIYEYRDSLRPPEPAPARHARQRSSGRGRPNQSS